MIVASASQTAERVAADRIDAPGAVECEGPFARDTTHKKLVAAFGASNVVYGKKIRDTWSPGFTARSPGTVLYPQDSARRLKIFWGDPEHKRFLVSIVIDGKSQWSAGGLRLGMTLQQVETLNEQPFVLNNFNHQFLPGEVTFGGGYGPSLERFGECPANCYLNATFAAEASGAKLRELQGDTVHSDDPTLRPLSPTLSRIEVYYGGGCVE
jgi:hypothetical protein